MMSNKDDDDIFLENFLASAESFLKGKKIDRSPEARRRSRDFISGFISGRINAEDQIEKWPIGQPLFKEIDEEE